MGPRKRQKTIKSALTKQNRKDSKIQQNLQETSETSILESSTNDNEKSYLSLLPNEVLLYIYCFLSPIDLLSLTKLDNTRLTDLTYTVREVNVSSCRRDNPLHVSDFFTRTRVKYIQKLNFNYYFFIKPYELANLICRCKNLTSLSVVECGLTYNNIVNILNSCDKLEELAWNVGEVVQLLNICCPRIKRVYLFCDIKEVSLNSVYYTIRNFPKVENVWINFSPDSLSALPFIGLWLWSSCVSSVKLSRQFTLTTNSFQCVSIGSDLVFLSKIINRELHGSDDDVDPSDPVRSRVYNNPPYLQIRSIIEDISLLSSGPFNTYSTVAIILTSEIINVSENLIKCMKEIAGDKLRHLSLQSEAQCFAPNETPLPMADEEAVVACDVLEKMFLTSKYITVLNLTTVHFSSGSPIKAITQLTYLKVLSIPSCAFGNSAKLKHSQSFELSNVVSSCPKVEDFALNCCVNDSEQLTEEDIVCIKDWSFLKHLSIYFLVFRTCNFLQKVADSCVQLQSLSLISVAPKKVCLFTNDVIYLLKKAKNLRFIRINEGKFYPMFERFWAAIGEAENLEGICVITQSKGPVDKQTVIRGIKKLKYLHLFHFFAPRASDRLYSEARKSMQEHGVKNIKVEKFCNINSFSRSSGVQYYHQQPHFCCQHLHLKDIDIF